jgi:hypothetical protein
MHVKVQTSPCRRTYTGDDDTDEFHDLAYHHGAEDLQLAEDGNKRPS